MHPTAAPRIAAQGTILNNGGLSLELKTRAAGAGYSINHDIYLRSATFKAAPLVLVEPIRTAEAG